VYISTHEIMLSFAPIKITTLLWTCTGFHSINNLKRSVVTIIAHDESFTAMSKAAADTNPYKYKRQI
jgi:hypothetical protein